MAYAMVQLRKIRTYNSFDIKDLTHCVMATPLLYIEKRSFTIRVIAFHPRALRFSSRLTESGTYMRRLRLRPMRRTQPETHLTLFFDISGLRLTRRDAYETVDWLTLACVSLETIRQHAYETNQRYL